MNILSSSYIQFFSLLLSVGNTNVNAFAIPKRSSTCFTTRQFATLTDNIESDSRTAPAATPKTLGLITFDLDDTLYPIKTVVDEANDAFSKAMAQFGYEGIETSDIVKEGRKIRHELPPEEAAALSHTDVRSLAIRKIMEDITLERKLQAMADSDFASSVENLSKIVVESARKWAAQAVSPSIVDFVLTAWEMERHHASERHLYPEVINALREIKEQYPDVIIGAVTDGKANPLLMSFTLTKYLTFV